MTIWDVGGQTRIRALWRYYYSNCEAVIFVVDSDDRDRIEEAAEELHVNLCLVILLFITCFFEYHIAIQCLKSYM